MLKNTTVQGRLPQTEKEIPITKIECSDSTWDEYSSFHDFFTELLSYENSLKSSSDFWQLNYI